MDLYIKERKFKVRDNWQNLYSKHEVFVLAGILYVRSYDWNEAAVPLLMASYSDGVSTVDYMSVMMVSQRSLWLGTTATLCVCVVCSLFLPTFELTVPFWYMHGINAEITETETENEPLFLSFGYSMWCIITVYGGGWLLHRSKCSGTLESHE